MSWLCFIKHKWNYKFEDITFTRRKSKVRLCERCYKKQRFKVVDWVDCELKKQEQRDNKLKSIGV
jgi:hypothetical protein